MLYKFIPEDKQGQKTYLNLLCLDYYTDKGIVE